LPRRAGPRGAGQTTNEQLHDIQAALARLRIVELSAFRAFAQVLPFLEQFARRIDMGVDDDGVLCQLARGWAGVGGEGVPRKDKCADGEREAVVHW